MSVIHAIDELILLFSLVTPLLSYLAPWCRSPAFPVAFVGSAGADSAIEQSSETARSRGLLAAPIVVGTGDSASMPTSSMAHGVDDQLTDKKVLVGPEGGSQLVTSESSLVTETVRGAALRVDDVTVVTPTGE